MVTTHSIKYIGKCTMYNKKADINNYLNPILSIFSAAVLSTLSSMAIAQSTPNPSFNVSSVADSSSSCDIYKHIEQSDTPIDLNNLTQTPNGIEVHSNDLDLQVEDFQPCKASKPFSSDKEAIALYQQLEHDLDKIAEIIIRDVPEGFSKYKGLDNEELDQIIKNVEQVKQKKHDPDKFINVYIYMAVHSYLGEFVPKDDAKAVQYMSYVVDYHQAFSPNDVSPLLNYMVAVAITEKQRHISDNNPINLQHETESSVEAVTAYLLSKAGHLDTKAILVKSCISRMNKTLDDSTVDVIHQLFDPNLKELEDLSKQGSYVATNELTELYERLKTIDLDYAEQARRWEDRVDTLP
jgi:hypothetical protein